MKKVYKSIMFLLVVLFFTACSHFNYIGDSYAPTKDVAVYFSEKEIKAKYKIMGHAVVAGKMFVSIDDLKERLIQEARDNGADAVLIKDIDRDAEPEDEGFDAEKQIKASFLKHIR
jgi:hypothetical protein